MSTITRGRHRQSHWLGFRPVAASLFLLALLIVLTACGGQAAKITPTEESRPVNVTEPESDPVVEETAYDEPTATDFTLSIRTLEKKCFGSAGCNVTFQIDAGWTVSLDPDKTYEVTYEIKGGDDALINTMEVAGDEYWVETEELIGTPSSDAELKVVVLDVRERGL